MPRIRDIKPDFFLDEELARLSETAQLAFIGLWCHSDREGRAEDRPERLRAQIFPYKPGIDMDEVLNELAMAEGEFVLRYYVGGRRFIQVRSFGKHQHPHPKEQASVIPSPDSKGVTMVAPVMRRHGVAPMPVLETASREKKRQAAEGLASKAELENPAGTCRSGSSLTLTPGSSLPSGSLDPDSCAEPAEPASPPPDPVLLEYPTVGRAKTWGLTQRLVDELQEAFPSLDIRGEARKARTWVEVNQAKRKTASGMPKFLFAWMQRAQENPRAAPARASPPRDVSRGWGEPSVSHGIPGDQKL